MGACKSKTATPTVSVNSAILSKMQKKIKVRLQQQSNYSTKVTGVKQKVMIRQNPSSDNSYYFKQKMDVEKGPFGIFGKWTDCPVYGCGHDVSQTSKLSVVTFNSNVVNETEQIWKDISTSLKQNAKSGMSKSGARSANQAINSSANLVKDNIRTKLVNLSQQKQDTDQEIIIEYDTPFRCSDPCGEARGPKIEQKALIQLASNDILNSSLKLIDEEMANHNLKVKHEGEGGESNSECIVQLIIIGIAVIVCLVISWKIFKMVKEERRAGAGTSPAGSAAPGNPIVQQGP